jgi:DNA-binding transcriptional ArsR family regulator
MLKCTELDISKYFDIMLIMTCKYEDMIKALGNESRWQILQWLKNPKKHFPHHKADVFEVGVCCGAIQEKLGMSQSTVSHYLSLLERCGLLESRREGQWTFYRRNEVEIEKFIAYLHASL